MTQYRRGRQAEYWARDQLKEDGYHTVVRAAGSKGIFDLVALGEHNVKLLQVKRVMGKRMPKYGDELDAMRAVQVPECCQKELWIFSDERKAWVIVPA